MFLLKKLDNFTICFEIFPRVMFYEEEDSSCITVETRAVSMYDTRNDTCILHSIFRQSLRCSTNQSQSQRVIALVHKCIFFSY